MTEKRELITTIMKDTKIAESPGKPALAVELAKGVATDHQAKPGDSGTVSL